MSSARWPAYFAIAGLFIAALGVGQCVAKRKTAHPYVPVVVQAVLPTVFIQAQADTTDRYRQLRARVHWVKARIGDDTLLTPDVDSRMLLAKSAAQRAGLAEVGLGFADV
jgi:hypothetical protein